MNRESVRQLLLLFLNMFADMGYQSFVKINGAGMEIQLSLDSLISDLEMKEEGSMIFVDELLRKFGGDTERLALEELSVAIRELGNEEVTGDPGVASALRQAEAILGVKVER